jgi:hypothetical protein
MKKEIYIAGLLAVVGCVQAQMIDFTAISGDAITTGERIDGVRQLGITTPVVEISGLHLTARSGSATQTINALNASCGIDSDGSGDHSSRLEAGEQLIISFDRDIQINRFDFNHFFSNEVITVAIEGMGDLVIDDEALSNRVSDYLDTNLVVSADTEITFYTISDYDIGLDGLDITVLDPIKEFALSVDMTPGNEKVMASFSSEASTNYVLQYRNGLTDSNGWSTASAPFSTNSTWEIETTHTSGFFRAIIQ